MIRGIFAEYLILAWVVVSVFSVGMAICHRWFSRRGIDLLGYGAAAGVFVHSLCGVLIASFWHARHAFALLLPIGALVALVYLVRQRVFSELAANLNRTLRIALCVWLVFLSTCVLIPHLEVSWPANLPDGLYVFKTHRQNVKVQYLSNLPADNFIPYIVTEFFVRHISFTAQRPILPGQEVSNRTILMSLVAVPFRTVLNWNNIASKKLGTFRYVETDWPNVDRLNNDNSFEQFLPIGIFLNALLLLGLLVLFSNLEPAQSLIPAALLFATSPYCIIQTIFTWPKALAGFFLVLAWDSIRRHRNAKIVGALVALAYHSHPAGIAAVVSLGIWYAWRALRQRGNLRPFLEYCFVVGAMILPWIIWTQLVLKIPTDLITQNFAGAGSAAAPSVLLDFIWIRALNFFNTLAPLVFTVYPFNLADVVNYSAICLSTAVGLVLIPFSIFECVRRARSEPVLIWFCLTIPVVTLLLVFSYPAVPLLHGWQAAVGALIFFGVLMMRRIFSQRVFAALVVLQLACNLTFIYMRALLVGAHW